MPNGVRPGQKRGWIVPIGGAENNTRQASAGALTAARE